LWKQRHGESKKLIQKIRFNFNTTSNIDPPTACTYSGRHPKPKTPNNINIILKIRNRLEKQKHIAVIIETAITIIDNRIIQERVIENKNKHGLQQ